MKYKVDHWSNFCRVFRLPKKYSSEFCFGGGHPTNFQMVDWFYPIPQEEVPIAGVSKKVWEEECGPIIPKEYDGDELSTKISDFLKGKMYIRPEEVYLCICSFGLSFVFDSNGLVTNKREN